MASFHLLPPNLAALAPLCAAGAGRYAFNGVLVEATDDGGLAVVATDACIMGVVVLPAADAEAQEKYQAASHLAAAPNSGKRAVIPTDAYVNAFKAVPKGKRVPEVQRCLAIKIAAGAPTPETPEEPSIALSSSDGALAESFVSVPSLGGRYPGWREIFPTGRAALKIALPIKGLRRLLEAAEKFAGVDGAAVFTFRNHGMTRPEHGPAFRGLVVPVKLPLSAE
jgi:hypothetical protein